MRTKDLEGDEDSVVRQPSQITNKEDNVNLKKEILTNYDKLDIGRRKFTNGITLGYVTVWNNHGYDVAKWAAKKFTHIVPVWFQINSAHIGDEQLTCTIKGTHDIDIGWIEDVRRNNSNVQIIPRFLFENWHMDELKQFLVEEQAQYRCIRAIIDLILRTQIDGAVIEIWLQIMAMTRGSAAEYLLELVEFWANEFHKAGLIIILPLSPPLDENFQQIGIVNKNIINRLLDAVDFVNVMTYDYPNPEISGVAPIDWVEANIEYLVQSSNKPDKSSKILMGLNFYGYDRTGGGMEAVLGKRFIEALKSPNSKLVFDQNAAEYQLLFGKNGVIYYPTIRSIQMRLDLAAQLHIGGVAIWDLGQGLDHFTSVF